jgi:glycosyltransferase involved in cell wall biosynthesis
MMRSLAQLGHSISLLTALAPNPMGIQGIDFEWLGTFGDLPTPEQIPALPKLQSKFCSYWGIDIRRPLQIQNLVQEKGFDVVVVVGLHVLPYLACVKNALRVWYAADEWFLHHWSLVQWANPSSWSELKAAFIKGVYERTFTQCVDRVWAVSKVDARFFKMIMGAKKVDIVPNGVDFEHFRPLNKTTRRESCVFWGRLDFEPNHDAIQWFGDKVFKPLLVKRPGATWTVYGFGANASMRKLQAQFGFELICDLPDLRSSISEHELVVLPFVSGAGLKNKFLEAAALGMPIVASMKATNGLSIDGGACRIVNGPNEWLKALTELWDNQEDRQRLGAEARSWVVANHNWQSCALTASQGINGA